MQVEHYTTHTAKFARGFSTTIEVQEQERKY